MVAMENGVVATEGLVVTRRQGGTNPADATRASGATLLAQRRAPST